MTPSTGNAQWFRTRLRRPFDDRLAGAQAHTDTGGSMGRIRATLLSGPSEIPSQMMLLGYHSPCGTAGNHAGNRAEPEQAVHIPSTNLSPLELGSLCVEHYNFSPPRWKETSRVSLPIWLPSNQAMQDSQGWLLLLTTWTQRCDCEHQIGVGWGCPSY